jgi:hypothetical protein
MSGTPFTSVTTGSWSDGATWGNTSPGTKGVDWPGLAGDVTNIGHLVNYNVSETNELGAMTITNGGILSFVTNASTKLTLGNVDLTINNGGELRIGASGAIIPYTYTAELYWNTTGDATCGIKPANGGKLTIYGDPVYYGSDDMTVLQADWTSGQSFTVIGNYSAKWVSGQQLVLHKGALYSNYNSDFALVTLNGAPSNASNSICAINESFPGGTFKNTTGRIVNVSRNVILGKLNATTTIGAYNSNRPIITDSNAVGTTNVKCNDATFVGISYYQNGFPILNRCVTKNGYLGTFNATLSGDDNIWFSLTYGQYSPKIAVQTNIRMFNCQYAFDVCIPGFNSGYIYGNQYLMQSGYGTTSSLNIYSLSLGINNACNIVINDIYLCATAVANSYNILITGNMFGNTIAIRESSDVRIHGGKIGYDSNNNLVPNTTDFYFGNYYYSHFKCIVNAKTPDPPVINGRNSTLWGGIIGDEGVYCEDYQGILGASHVFLVFGDVIKNIVTVRSGGAASSLEVVPLSNCGLYCSIPIFEWAEFNVPASPQTRTVYIKGEGWSTFPTAAQLYIQAEYYSDATLMTKTTAVSTAVLTDNTTWTAFAVTFTPAQVSYVRYKGYLKTYASACKVYVDNMIG